MALDGKTPAEAAALGLRVGTLAGFGYITKLKSHFELFIWQHPVDTVEEESTKPGIVPYPLRSCF